jgi:drug/metabolite transporter (DMT)-like permease
MKKAFIQLHIAVFLAGFTGILGKLITLNEGLLVWYRLLISVVTIWLITLWTKTIRRIPAIAALKIFGIGVVAALHWVSFYGSIKMANVSIALVCFSAIGFFTAILEPLIFRKKLQERELMLGILVMIGISFIFQFDPRYRQGIFIGIIAAILGSIFPILSRKLLQDFEAETVTIYELTGGLIFLSFLLPFYLKLFPTNHLLPNKEDFLWLLILSWICTVIAFNLSMKALRKISAFTVNLTFNLEPIYGIILAFFIFREDKHLNKEFYIGLFLIFLAIVLEMAALYNGKRKVESEKNLNRI